MGFIILQTITLLAMAGLLVYIWREDTRTTHAREDEARVPARVTTERRHRR